MSRGFRIVDLRHDQGLSQPFEPGRALVRELADFLEKEGDIEAWLDEREIAPGQNIVSRIEEGLDADFILLILSPDSVDSSWVKEEWTDAFWEQTNDRKTKLLGVLYRDCKIRGCCATRNTSTCARINPRLSRNPQLSCDPAARAPAARELPAGPPTAVHRPRKGAS